MASPEMFEDKFVAFIDVLGFRNLVDLAERKQGPTLAELRDVVKRLGNERDISRIRADGPSICPNAARQVKDVGFELTQASDSVIVSTEISPAGFIGILEHCHIAAMRLLKDGFLCRGYITRGLIFHRDGEFYGSAYQRALSSEPNVAAFRREVDDRGTPFIEFDPQVVSYAEAVEDACVHLMFDRLTKTDGTLRAIFPFSRLSHGFMIGGLGIEFNPDKERRNNQVMREIILGIKSKLRLYLTPGNSAAVRKVEHYEAALDAQLAICDMTDRTIDDLCTPFPAPRLPR